MIRTQSSPLLSSFCFSTLLASIFNFLSFLRAILRLTAPWATTIARRSRAYLILNIIHYTKFYLLFCVYMKPNLEIDYFFINHKLHKGTWIKMVFYTSVGEPVPFFYRLLALVSGSLWKRPDQLQLAVFINFFYWLRLQFLIPLKRPGSGTSLLLIGVTAVIFL